jgi:hypothetical protein
VRAEAYGTLREGTFLRRYARELLALPAEERALRARQLWQDWQPLVSLEAAAARRYEGHEQVMKQS